MLFFSLSKNVQMLKLEKFFDQCIAINLCSGSYLVSQGLTKSMGPKHLCKTNINETKKLKLTVHGFVKFNLWNEDKN